MSSAAELSPGEAEADDAPSPPSSGPLPGLLRSTWLGTNAGVRRASYVAGPIAILALIPGLALSGLGLGAGRGWPIVPRTILPPILYGPVGFYLVCAVWGMVVGAPLGLVVGLIRRGRPGSRRARLWAMAHRPIYILPRHRIDPGRIAFAPPRRRRVWRWLVGLPATLALLATVVGGGLGLHLGRVVDRRLADAIASADRDDPHWRLDDLMAHREPVPDEENSALIVSEALGSVRQNWPDTPWPPPGVPRARAGPELAAFERLGETPGNVRPDDMTTDILRGQLDEYAEAVRLLRTVADYRRGRHELVVGPTVFDTPLPETQASRTAARLLSADAAIRSRDGDFDGALDSCRAIIGVGRSIGDEPCMISQLVRFAIGYVATGSARRVLGQGEPSDEALAGLQDLVLDERAQPLLPIGIRGERAMLYEAIRRVRDGEIPVSALNVRASRRIGSATASWGRLLFDYQRAIALEWMNEAVAISSRPSATRADLWKVWEGNIFRLRDTWHSSFTASLPLVTMPAAVMGSRGQTRYQTDLGATALLIAAERHRLKTGDWPASLAEIDPAILPEAPTDPFSGRPYRFEREDGRIMIYSVGPNLKDDRGLFDQKRSEAGGPDDVAASAWDVPLRGLPADDRREP